LIAVLRTLTGRKVIRIRFNFRWVTNKKSTIQYETPAMDNDRRSARVVDMAAYDANESEHRQFIGNSHIRPFDVVEMLYTTCLLALFHTRRRTAAFIHVSFISLHLIPPHLN